MTESLFDYQQIVEDFYVSNIKNRLRELETADDDEQTRWIWELIQNAKDCSKELVDVSKYTTKFKAVDIKIIFDENARKVIFKHNGIPFTNETLYSLIYKYSSKNDREESTGRFGTGFMTSHTLSRIVYIKAPFLFKKNNSYELKRVETTVFREGSNEKQFREEFKKMEKSKKVLPYDLKNSNHKWTTFIYHLNDKGIHSAKLGIQSLYKNIQKEPNQRYSEKYSKDQGKELINKNLNFDIVIPIGSKSKITDRNDKEICIFCTFPLIGSENFQLPYIINCAAFETSTERKGLILDGEEEDSSGILTNTGLNHLVLNKSIDLFSNVIDFFIENNYSNYSSFSDGVQFPNQFTERIKSVLENKPIVYDCSNQLLPLNKVIFLDFNNINDTKLFHELSSSFYLNIAAYDECIRWNNKTWDKLFVLNVEYFVQNLQNLNSSDFYKRNYNFFKNGLNSLTKNDFSLLNRTYSFLLNEETKAKSFDEIARTSKFLKEKIILNSKCKLVYLIDLKSNYKFNKDMNKIMEQCKTWKDTIIHPKIKSFDSIIPQKTIEDAIQEVNNYIIQNKEKIYVLLSFVKYVIKDNKQRNNIYEIADFFCTVPEPIFVTKVDPKLWEKVDYYLLIRIKEIIEKKLNSIIELSSLKHYDKFYKLYQQICNKTDFLVPNYNLILKNKKNLKSLSKEIPQALLDSIKSFYDFDVYIHPSINSVTLKKRVDDLDYFINLLKSENFFYSDEKLNKSKLFAILSIFPPENKIRLHNFQIKIKDIAQFFFNVNINESKTNIKDETFWETVDEIVINYVTNKLHKFKTIQKLKSKLNQNETNIFKYLNYYYSIISSNYKEKKDTVLIPNYYGIFKLSQNLFIGKGLEEKLYDLINKANNESDIKEKIAHPEVQCDFLKVMDFKYFIGLLNEKLSEEQLVNDKKIVDSIFNNLTIFNEQSINIFERLYVANMKNRLNEIQNPTDSDKIRWPMELMQNAKDSLFLHQIQICIKNIEINIEIHYNMMGNPTKVLFSHNGPSFTENSFYGLLFKICEGKEHFKTTGKFGTGFISTHVLSKIVNISGNRIDENNKITGFSITLYREGTKDQDILNDFKKMAKSYKSYNETMDLTKFEYQISSKESIKCVKLGLIHFKKHIANVLINCKEIKCVNLIDNNKKTTYSQAKLYKKQVNKFFICKYNIFSNNNILQQFIKIKDEDKISIAIEIDSNIHITPRDRETESIFSVFPLVGSKSHILPYFLNSSNLEPVTERNALILHGEEIIDGEITNCGKNRSIMIKSIDLFEKLIQTLTCIKCPNLYELTYGLLLSTCPYETFDLKWYNANFLKKIRNVILNNVKAKTYFGETLFLKEIIFPSKQIDEKNVQSFIELSSRFYQKIICVEDELIYINRIWNNVSRISIEDLIDQVKEDDSIIEEKNLVFLNKFLLFIWKFNKDLLYEHPLIPDMNGVFHTLSNSTDNLRECKTVSDQIIRIMESIDIPWKSTHMSNFKNTICLDEDKNIDAESRIIDKIKQDQKLSVNLMEYVLEGSELRKNIYDFVNLLEMKNFDKPIIVNNIDPKIWELADEYVLKQIVLEISFFNSTEIENNMDFFIKFLPIFFNFFSKDKKYINSCKIIPNANYVLCKIDELSKKANNFHDFLNSILIRYYDKDFDDKIINPQIDPYIECNKKESIIDFLSIINDEIDDKEFDDQIIIAESVISIVPTNQNNISSLNEPKEIFSLNHDLINSDIEELIIDEKDYLSQYWEKSKKIIISYICKKVEETETLVNFQNCFDLENEEEAFEKLNLLYKFDIKDYEIIPNKNGDFMSKNDLKANPGIKDDILECFTLMDPENDFINEIVHDKVKINGLDNFNIVEIIQQFNYLYQSTNSKKDVNIKIKEIIYNICNESPFLHASNELTNDMRIRMDIVISGHIDYVKNRMRDLDNATIDDFKRWPFELIQNARDCVRDSKQKVSMTFEFKDNCVIFTHNAIPFTNRTLNALLYQCSEGKDENKLSVGRFGTGFMATHILSRIIHEITNRINDENAFELMKFSIQNDKKREKMLYYTQMILVRKFNIVFIEITNEYKDLLYEMFHKIDMLVSKQLIKRIQNNNFDIQENISKN